MGYGNFSDKELVDLTLAIVAINGWNRLAISFRTVPGTFQPASQNRAVAAVGRGSEPESGREKVRTGSH
jgi:hypothetical protein